jgi:multidrug transporter EmrE-like cation transporter
MNSWLLMTLGVGLSAAAQLLLKLGVSAPRETPQALLGSGEAWQVPVGASLYVLAFLVYLQVLARFDLSYASPVMVGGVTLLVLAAGAALGETVGPARLFGALLVVAGISLLTLDAR